MKKIITFAGIAILFVLLSAPSFVKAAFDQVGSGIYIIDGVATPVSLIADGAVTRVTLGEAPYNGIRVNYGGLWYGTPPNGVVTTLQLQYCVTMYIPTLEQTTTLTRGDYSCTFYNDLGDYKDSLPEEFQPSWNEKLWDGFLDFLEFQLGLDPFDGGIWEFFSKYFQDPENESLEIIYPTNVPTPTPTPRPTPIPVQTIYIPDGNGSYTIIYQYPDPSGTITQSPYNPNIDVNVDVDCNCDSGPQNYYPQDPMYAPLEGLSWSSPDGSLTGSPAMSASQSLDAIKAEVDSYDEPIKVVSNSFGALPAKWLGLVGLLGACLIVAGLIRTFLGG